MIQDTIAALEKAIKEQQARRKIRYLQEFRQDGDLISVRVVAYEEKDASNEEQTKALARCAVNGHRWVRDSSL